MVSLMDKSMSKPCPDAVRIQRLAATNPEDLSPSEYEELKNHTAGCQQCALLYRALRDEYRQMDALIRNFPADESVPRLSFPPLKPRKSGGAAQSVRGELVPSLVKSESFNRAIKEELTHSLLT